MIQSLFALSALAMLAYGLRFAGGEPGKALAPALLKTSPVALLAICAALSGVLWTILAGLILGALGDFLLARPSEKAFLAGMGAFALGHLAYAAGFAPGFPKGRDWAVLATLALLILSTELWLAPHTGALRWPVRLYGLVIGAMAAAAVLMAPRPGGGLVQTGAALFVLSDLLLALALFTCAASPARRVLSLALWPLYWGGQALILAGFLAG